MPPGATLVRGADETVERRSGRQSKAKGGDREAGRAARKHVGKGLGRKGGALRRLVPVPWATRGWAVPVLTVRWWPPQSRHQRRPKTRVDWGRQLLKQPRRGWPGRLLGLVGEGGVAAVARAGAWVNSPVTRVARWR